MSQVYRFLIGGVGGLLPLLVTFVTLDTTSFAFIIDHGQLTVGVCLGYFLRGAILFVLGGLIAWANASVSEPLTLIQIGVAAPALVTSYLTGAVLAKDAAPAHAGKAETSWIFGSAYGGERSAKPPIELAGFWKDVRKGLSPGLEVDPIYRVPQLQYKAVSKLNQKCYTVGGSIDSQTMNTLFPADQYEVSEGGCPTPPDVPLPNSN